MKKEPQSFTKQIMYVVVCLYFLGATIGTILVAVAALVDIMHGSPLDTAMFVAYAAYLGGPTATAIGFYAWKSKAENILKIANSNKVQQEQPVDISAFANSLFTNMEG